MSTVCDVTNWLVAIMARLGTIRSLCLVVLTFTAIVLMVTSYIDRYEAEICAGRSQRHDARLVGVDRRKQYDDEDERDESRRRPVRNSGDLPTWDYNWDVYVNYCRDSLYSQSFTEYNC